MRIYNNCFYFLIIIICSLLSTASASSLLLEEGVNLYTGTSDTSIYEDQYTSVTEFNSNGGHDYLYLGMTQFGDRRRALIRFDLSLLPPSTDITSVSLRLYVDRARTSGEIHTLHRILKDWGEGTVDSGDPGGLGAPAEDGDATWRSNFHNQSLWDTEGGDFTTTPSASGIIASEGTEAYFESVQMTEDVVNWVINPSVNFGWILLGNETQMFNARRVVSSEGQEGLRPRLTIIYTPPSLTWWMLK